MKRVLQVIGGMNRAGAESMLMNIYRNIDRAQIQFDFLVYSNEKQDFEAEIEKLGGRVIHLPIRSGWFMINSVREIRRIIQNYGPYCAVHAHTLHNSAYAMLAAKSFKNIKRITHSHSTHNEVENSLLKKIYGFLTRFIIQKYAQIWLACGDEAGEYLFGPRFPKRGIVINNGIDVHRYVERDEQACQNLIHQYGLTGKIVLGSVARFEAVKNHYFLLEIAVAFKRRHIPFKMMLVGEGSLKKEVEARVNALQLQEYVLFLGVRGDISDLMQVFDVFLMPSIFEGNPVTLIEAQASGLPCVISDSITKKMDIGLGLIYRCNIESVEEWCEMVLRVKDKKCTDKEKIISTIIQKGYDIDRSYLKLINLYAI